MNKEMQETEITNRYYGFSQFLLKAVAIFTSLYQFYIGYFGAPYSLQHRPTHFLLVFIILFLLYPSKSKSTSLGKVAFWDWGLIILTIFTTGYLIINVNSLMERIPFVTDLTFLEYVFGISIIALILIATFRVIGASLTIVTIFFLLYGYFGKYLPGPLWHKGYSIKRIIEQLYLTLEGIWSTPLHVTSTFVYLFILFGTFLVVTGAGNFFTNLAFSLTHKSVGGPAKTAVVASSLMGTLSGSSTANVVTTGAFTIPMMKGIGYSPAFAGAVEAVASTGGQIVPPVMGAAAFIMAEFTGIAYVNIMKHALIPALLYYLGIFIMVHIEAEKLGIKTILKEDFPTVTSILMKQGYLFIPILAIIYFLFEGFTPLRAAFFAILLLLFLEFFKQKLLHL